MDCLEDLCHCGAMEGDDDKKLEDVRWEIEGAVEILIEC